MSVRKLNSPRDHHFVQYFPPCFCLLFACSALIIACYFRFRMGHLSTKRRFACYLPVYQADQANQIYMRVSRGLLFMKTSYAIRRENTTVATHYLRGNHCFRTSPVTRTSNLSQSITLIPSASANQDHGRDDFPSATLTHLASQTGNDCPNCCTIKSIGVVSVPRSRHPANRMNVSHIAQTKRVPL